MNLSDVLRTYFRKIFAKPQRKKEKVNRGEEEPHCLPHFRVMRIRLVKQDTNAVHARRG